MSAAPAFALEDLDRRLRRLEAIEAIKHVIARYTDGADKKNDPAIMGPLFRPDGIWEAVGFGRHVGSAAIAAALAEIARSRITWSVHFMVLPTITIADDFATASCAWYLWELAKIAGDDGIPRDSWFAAKYQSTLAAGHDGWQFSHLILNPLMNCAVGEAWPGSVPVPG